MQKTIKVSLTFTPETTDEVSTEITDLFSELFLREISAELSLTDLSEILEDFEITVE